MFVANLYQDLTLCSLKSNYLFQSILPLNLNGISHHNYWYYLNAILYGAYWCTHEMIHELPKATKIAKIGLLLAELDK